jgi:hypothetical protein
MGKNFKRSGQKCMIKFVHSLDFIFIAEYDRTQKQWCLSYGQVLVRGKMKVTTLK